MTATVRVVARLVDGGEMDWAFPPQFFLKLDALEAQGLRGKQLIDALITDDWGPPPVLIRIIGIHPNGRRIDRIIEYD